MLKELVANPAEALSVELKSWFDPLSPEGIAKIARCCIAMRNNNGGYLLIGFNDQTCQPDDSNRPSDVRQEFHSDRIQSIVSKYASILFEAETAFLERDGKDYPIVSIGGGVTTPVAAKADLRDSHGKVLIRAHQVYVRSLNANGRVSTTEIRYQDWEQVMAVCWDNREADIGRFLRRHLANIESGALKDAVETLTGIAKKKPDDDAVIDEILNDGLERFQASVKDKSYELPSLGSMEIGVAIIGEMPPFSANQNFLNTVMSSNPRLTGWPLWLDSRGFSDKRSHPYVFQKGWEALLVALDRTWGGNHIDFWRIEPRGRFYHRRALEDDTIGGPRAPRPMTAMDFTLVILRVAEAIAVSRHAAQAIGCDPAKCELKFGFRWTGLKGRVLCSWINPMRSLMERNTEQNSVVSSVTVGLDAPDSSIFEHVKRAIGPLFETFEGFEIGAAVVEELTNKLLSRKL